MSVGFLGDFMYIYSEGEEEIAEEENKVKVEELMDRHYEYMAHFLKEDEYVTRGSVLWCNEGTRLAVFDIPIDHGVGRENGDDIGHCNDCDVNRNIYSFGGCKKPSPNGGPKRKMIVANKIPSKAFEMEKCIPILAKSWETTSSTGLKIWEYRDRQYYDVITTGDYLTCFYGGVISVLEVPHITYPVDYVKVHSRSINCYGYVMGGEWKEAPGSFSGKLHYVAGERYEVGDLAEYVVADLEFWGKEARLITSVSDKTSDEYVIAIKTSTRHYNYVYDFHFAVQLEDGTWADKPGDGASRWNYLDGTADTWDLEEDDGYYNTESKYIAVKKNKNISEREANEE